MKKLKQKGGFTLIEMLVCVLIMAILAVGMGTGITTAMRVYRDAVFCADSSSAAYNLNETMSDLLRYSTDIDPHATPAGGASEVVTFTNYNYGAEHVYLTADTDTGSIRMRSLMGTSEREIINLGAYPELKVTDMNIVYNETEAYFTISYKIQSVPYPEKVSPVECTVRVLNG